MKKLLGLMIIALRSAGIKEAIYTIDNGIFASIDLEKDLSHLKVYSKRGDSI